MFIISKTGCGKSFLNQTLGNAVCRRFIPTRSVRLADICEELNRSRSSGDGTFYSRMDALKTVQLLIVDDFMTTSIATQNAVDLFEVMEARRAGGRRSSSPSWSPTSGTSG